jgi:hypothetical protein
VRIGWHGHTDRAGFRAAMADLAAAVAAFQKGRQAAA